MRTFDDFDAWTDAIRGAELRTVCDRSDGGRWRIGAVSLGSVAVQVAEEGGGNLAYGQSVHPGPILFVPVTRVDEYVANGERLDEGSFLLIPPHTDFRIHVRRCDHAWCSIALPPTEAAGASPTASGRVAPGAAIVGRMRRLALAALGELGPRADCGPAHASAAAELLAAAAACLGADTPGPVSAGRPKIDRSGIIRRMMGHLEASPDVVLSPVAVGQAIGVHERTLQRAVRETYGTTTKEYLVLRSLHAVRRRLVVPPDDAVGVTDILAGLGIWEFGRFAGRYRRHFGELPSETLKRARA